MLEATGKDSQNLGWNALQKKLVESVGGGGGWGGGVKHSFLCSTISGLRIQRIWNF